MYLKLLNENGECRRERLRDNKVVEDLTERSSMFISSRLESHSYPGQAIHQIIVSDLPNLFYPKTSNSSFPSSYRDLMSEERLLDDDGSPNPIRIPVEKLSESTLLKIRRLYSSLLMLTEDACNATAYLYTCQPLFPTYFNPKAPFSPVELFLISGNIVLRTSPFSRGKEEGEGEGEGEEKKENENEKEKEKEKEVNKEIPKNENESKPINIPPSKPATIEVSKKPSDGMNGMDEVDPIRSNEVTPLFGLKGHTLEDPRACDLCGEMGDSLVCGRMLCTSTGEWVHLNCVYYSSGITIDEKASSIQKYTVVKNRSRSVQCYVCKRSGASIKCGASGCNRCFHFACGRRSGCLIRVNKEAFCQYHRPLSSPLMPTSEKSFNPFSPRGVSISMSNTSTRSAGTADFQVAVSSSELFTTRFNHRVVFLPQRCAFRSGVRRSRSLERGLIRLGSVTVSHVGVVGISPRMHTEQFIFPDQYRVFRVFWSVKRPGTRTLYCAEIHAEAEGEDPQRGPVFSISDVQSEIRFCSQDIQSRNAKGVRNRRVWRAAIGVDTKRTLRETATASTVGGRERERERERERGKSDGSGEKRRRWEADGMEGGVSDEGSEWSEVGRCVLESVG